MNRTKKVLILGAGVYQLPLIRKAAAEGHHVCAASWSAEDPGMQLAHEPWVVDVTDTERLLQLAGGKNIEAVVSSGTDVCMPSLGKICDELQLPGISYACATVCSNKYLMQKTFQNHGVPSAFFLQAGSLSEVKAAARKIGYPLVVKAVDSSGSRGIQAAFTPEDVQPAWENARQVARGETVLVESMLQGEEFGCQIIVDKGEVLRVLPHNDIVTPPPVSVPIGHSCPFLGSLEVVEQTAAVCARAVQALGIEQAVCNVDLMLTENGVFVLELGARIGATGIPEIMQTHYGLDLYQIALDMALGRSVTWDEGQGPACAYHVLHSPLSGVVREICLPQSAMQAPGVQEVRIDVVPGDRVRCFHVGPDRIGHVLTSGDTVAEAEQRCQWVAQQLRLDVHPE